MSNRRCKTNQSDPLLFRRLETLAFARAFVIDNNPETWMEFDCLGEMSPENSTNTSRD